MPLANSHGPRWIRAQNMSVDNRLRGIAPIRTFLARLFGRAPTPPRRSGPPSPPSDVEASSPSA
jgi:hypothetical protein